MTDDDGRVERIAYELCVLMALRDALRRREVYVAGASRWKDPEADLPADFDENRDVHYYALGKSLDATEFVDGLRKPSTTAYQSSTRPDQDGTSGGVRIITRQGSPWVSVPKLDKLPEPRNLAALKAEVAAPVGHHRPARHPEGHRVHHWLHRVRSPPSPPGRCSTAPP